MTHEEVLVASLGVPVVLEQVQVGARQINYVRAGTGKPLVLIHGANIGWGMWYTTIADLAREYTVYALDLPECGGSTKIGSATLDLETDFAQVVEQCIKQLGLQSVSVIGHSFGGWIALRLALRKAVMVDKIVLVDSLGFSRFLPVSHRLVSLRPFAEFLAAKPLSPTREHMKEFLAEPLVDKNIMTDAFFEYFYESIFRNQLSHPILFINALTSFFRLKKQLDLSVELPGVSQPVLIIWGEKDTSVPLAKSQPQFRHLPHATVVIFPETGHVPPLEQSKLFTEKLLAFLG